MASASSGATEAYGISAGLDLIFGVFDYLAAQSAASMAQSRADLIRIEAEANAQRYSEQAAQFQAHEKVMYLASGVTLAGSPVDALATSARIANENVHAILMGGEAKALDEQTAGVNSANKGRDALIGGLTKDAGLGYKALGGGGRGDLGAASEMAANGPGFGVWNAVGSN